MIEFVKREKSLFILFLAVWGGLALIGASIGAIVAITIILALIIFVYGVVLWY